MPCYSGFPRQSGRDAVKKKEREKKRDSNRRKEVEEYTDKGIERKRERGREREFQTALRRKGGACRRVQLATDLIYDTPTWCVHPRRDDDVRTRVLASKIARDPVVR